MASYCCFRKSRQPTHMPVEGTIFIPDEFSFEGDELISLQDMLGLLGRPGVGVVVIRGIGGSGKTWAAKSLYQAAKTSNLFDEYIWVSLSINCSMRKCFHKIAASCKIRDSLSVESTRTIIKEYLTPRKFLLVLDNAYFTEESILEYLGVPDPRQQMIGSKILVTTRTTRAQTVMLPNIEIMPQPLTYKKSYDLLCKKIGKGIRFKYDLISNCNGNPLTIILLAGVLYDGRKEETFSKLVKNAHAALAMQRMVKFAYYQLPSDNVRHCLLYFLIFPDDQGIPVKKLIWHWKIDGLLQEAVGFDEANHVGNEILDVLITHGMVYLDGNDHVHMHNVIRETVSRFGKDMGDKEHLSIYDNRVSLMDTETECLYESPNCQSETDGQVKNTDSIFENLYFRARHFTHSIDHMGYLEMDGTIGIPSLTDGQVRNTDSTFENLYFRAKHFTHSIDPMRYLEIDGTIGIPSDLDGILCHAEFISLKRLVMTTGFSDLNVRRMEAVRELWVENCDHLESLLSADEVQALSTVGNLHNLSISNMEKLSSLCNGVEDVTSFSCLKHLLLDCCPKLLYLFPSALRLPNLETLHIRFCDVLERVFDSSVLGADTLPRLQSLQLWELPDLTSVCGGVLPSLKNLKVRGCAKLRKIPVGVNENSPFVTTTGEQLWWDSLLWDDQTIKRWLLFRHWGPLLPHLATEG